MKLLLFKFSFIKRLHLQIIKQQDNFVFKIKFIQILMLVKFYFHYKRILSGSKIIKF